MSEEGLPFFSLELLLACRPFMGALPARPAERFPWLRGGVFEQYPYALPGIVVSRYCILRPDYRLNELVQNRLPFCQ